MTQTIINFYRERDDYGCFSNFSHHNLVLKGKEWKTSEHYFQAQKYEGTEYEEQVRLAHDAAEAKKLGGRRDFPLRKDWEAMKEEIMKDALRAKFSQHKDLQKILLSTDGAKLVEHTRNDSYWGDGGDGSGKNRLGICLMQVREEMIRNKSNNNNDNSQPNTAETVAQPSSDAPQTDSTASGASSDDTGDSEDSDSLADVAPNRNKEIEPDTILSAADAKHRSNRRGKNKSRPHSKRAVFKDFDGNSTMEKKADEKGNIQLVGEGNCVFPEKALPPQARFVVNKHQMRRKYQPTEADVEEEEDDQEEYKADSNNQYMLADFVPQTSPTKGTQTTNNDNQPLHLTRDECVTMAKNNLDLVTNLPADFPEVTEARGVLSMLKPNIQSYIESSDDANLSELISLFEQIDEILKR